MGVKLTDKGLKTMVFHRKKDNKYDENLKFCSENELIEALRERFSGLKVYCSACRKSEKCSKADVNGPSKYCDKYILKDTNPSV